MKVHNIKDKLPRQKDLVLVETRGFVVPAIYYKSLNGFYHFSLFYHTHKTNVYSKARTKDKWRIDNVTKWSLMPESL